MKIGIFADSHYAAREVSCVTRRPSLSYDKIKAAMDAFSAAKVDTVICLGDLVDHSDDPAENDRNLQRLSALIAAYPMPFYCLMGNHDSDIYTPDEFYARSGFNKPPFSLDRGDTVWIFLDANYTKAGLAYMPHQVNWVDTCLPADQLAALADILRREDISKVRVFLHEDLDPNVESHHLVANAAEIRSMLSGCGKECMVFEGHYHPGCKNTVDGVDYITIPAMCEGEENRYFLMEI